MLQSRVEWPATRLSTYTRGNVLTWCPLGMLQGLQKKQPAAAAKAGDAEKAVGMEEKQPLVNGTEARTPIVRKEAA